MASNALPAHQTGIGPTARCPHGIGLVFVDLDGTTVTAGHEVSPRVAQALTTVHARGVTLAVSSGRPIAMVPPAVRELGVMDYYLCTNGATVYDASLTCIRDASMPAHLALGVVRALAPLRPTWNAFVHGVGVAELGNMTYLVSDRRRIASYLGKTARLPTSPGKKLLRIARTASRLLFGTAAFRRVLDIRPTLARATTVEKLGCSFACADAATAAAQLLREAGFEVAVMGPRELEITAPGVSKGTSAAWLARRLGIERSRVVAFGDGANDASLAAGVGCFVAMGNADDQLKSIATCVCEDVDNDGVAAWLESQLDAS